MDEFSFDTRAVQIVDARTRQSFQEVLSSYTIGNYRSAVVVLWTIVICDILFKLRQLDELYNDAKAREILDEIQQMQADQNRSSQWESKLVELVEQKTELIDVVAKENLLYLQKQRHLAAHPIIDVELQLHNPNKDTVRSLMRNALDDVFTKASILSKKIVHDLLEDIAENASVLVTEQKMKEYLSSKYYSRFSLGVERAVFRSLWKLVFFVDNEQCEQNRGINYRALRILYDRAPVQFLGQVEDEVDYYSQITANDSQMLCLVHFLAKRPALYAPLAAHAKTKIQHFCDINAFGRMLGWFLRPTLADHVTQTISWLSTYHQPISADTWDAFRPLSDSIEWLSFSNRVASAYYGASPDFNSADKRFLDNIRPYLDTFTLDDCRSLLSKIEGNTQTHWRGRARDDHTLIKERVISLDNAFDFSPYVGFNASIA